MYQVSTFYAFVNIEAEHLPTHRDALLQSMAALEVRGTIILATEGFNATLCASPEAIAAFTRTIERRFDVCFSQTLSNSPMQAFGKSKVKIKPALVKLGAPLRQPEARGAYVEPSEWNAFITRDDVIVLDTRNSYETYLGTFKGAVDPATRKFNHLPEATLEALDLPKDKKIATFCTGGIRCEKYTAWLKEKGYEEVYHLKGGILRYLAEVPEEESLWEGSCYVFDDRVAVTHGLRLDEAAASCKACGHSLTASDLRHEAYVPGQRCAHCEQYPPSNYDLLDAAASG